MGLLTDAPDLAKVAIRSTSASNATKHSERSWGYLEYIHNRRRNRLTTSRADDLVYCYHNLRVLRRSQAPRGDGDDYTPWSAVEALQHMQEEGEDLDGHYTDEMEDA